MFLLLRSKGTSKEDAEDIIQNTFYKIYSMLSDLEEKTIRPWFYRVALNEFIDLKRKKGTASKEIINYKTITVRFNKNAY